MDLLKREWFLTPANAHELMTVAQKNDDYLPAIAELLKNSAPLMEPILSQPETRRGDMPRPIFGDSGFRQAAANRKTELLLLCLQSPVLNQERRQTLLIAAAQHDLVDVVRFICRDERYNFSLSVADVAESAFRHMTAEILALLLDKLGASCDEKLFYLLARSRTGLELVPVLLDRCRIGENQLGAKIVQELLCKRRDRIEHLYHVLRLLLDHKDMPFVKLDKAILQQDDIKFLELYSKVRLE